MSQCFHDWDFDVDIKKKSKKFLCLNREIQGRSHRPLLLSLLKEKNLIKDSYYSYYFNTWQYHDSWNDYGNIDKDLVDKMKTIFSNIKDELPYLLNLPMIKMENELYPDNPGANRFLGDKEMFNDSYFSVVTETTFFTIQDICMIPPVFITEKTIKLLKIGHPFVLVAPFNSIAQLKKYGFKTFHPYIDETYDTIIDDTKRLYAIANEIDRLCKLSDDEWLHILNELVPIFNHNKENLINKFTVCHEDITGKIVIYD